MVKFYNRFAFTKTSGYLLNLFTLIVKDPEISYKLKLRRFQQYSLIIKPLTLFALVDLAIVIASYFNHQGALIIVLKSAS